jgi:HK97 family phage portal protein
MLVEAIQDAFAALSFDGANPRDPAIKKILGLGAESKAGVSVDHEKVMAIPAVKRGVQIITDKIFGMPWYVFEEHQDGREYAKDHPSWRCMTSKANTELDDATVRQQLVQWAMTYGNGCAAIYWPNGWPDTGNVELVPLLPDRTWLERVPRDAAERIGEPGLANSLVYRTEIGGDVVRLAKSNVVHIKGLGPNPYWGWDVVDLLMEAFGGVIAKEEFSNRFFGQGATPAGFIEMTGSLDEESEETYMQSLKQAMHGLGKAHKIIVLEEGSKFNPTTVDPEKSQMLEGQKFDVRTVAMCIGVKPHKLIDGANSAFASLEQANQEHKDDDILPWVNKLKKEYNTKLLSEQQRESGSHSIDIDDEDLSWVPFSERSRGCVELYNNGLITKDEGRRKVNFGPSRAERAKDYRIPANIVYENDQAMVASNAAGLPSTPTQDEGDDEAAKITAAYAAKVRKRLHKIASAKAKAGSAKFLAWLDGLKTEQAETETLQVAVDATYKEFSQECNVIAERAINDEQLCDMIKGMSDAN